MAVSGLADIVKKLEMMNEKLISNAWDISQVKVRIRDLQEAQEQLLSNTANMESLDMMREEGPVVAVDMAVPQRKVKQSERSEEMKEVPGLKEFRRFSTFGNVIMI